MECDEPQPKHKYEYKHKQEKETLKTKDNTYEASLLKMSPFKVSAHRG